MKKISELKSTNIKVCPRCIKEECDCILGKNYENFIYSYGLRNSIIEDIKELRTELLETENNQRLLADKIDECNLNCPDLMVDEFEMIEKINQTKVN